MKLLELLKKELPVLKQAAKEDLQNLDKTAKDVIEKAKETVEEAKMFYEAVKVGFLAASQFHYGSIQTLFEQLPGACGNN